MSMNKSQKFIVLFALFVLPLVFYVLISTGVNNFAKLPVVTQNVTDVATISNSTQFKDRISIVTFMGDNPNQVKGGFFNLNQKIYKQFYEYKNFQFVVFVPLGKENEVEKVKKQLSEFTNMVKWKFVFAKPTEIKTIFNGLKNKETLSNTHYSNLAFIIDKDANLRGRTNDKDTKDGVLFGYNMESVAELNNKMKDDVKVILAEYRLALKKNDADRKI